MGRRELTDLVQPPATGERITLATKDEIQSGERLILEVDGKQLALFNIAGDYYCIADVCSHDDGPVAEGDLHGFEIECPRHGALFDVRNGKVLSFPAIVDIPYFPVYVVGDDLQIELPPD